MSRDGIWVVGGPLDGETAGRDAVMPEGYRRLECSFTSLVGMEKPATVWAWGQIDARFAGEWLMRRMFQEMGRRVRCEGGSAFTWEDGR